MRFKDVFKISLLNTFRTKSRAILTVLSICIGVSSVMLISILGNSGSSLISNEIEKLGINGITLYSKKETIPLDYKYIKDIQKNVTLASDVQPLIIEAGGYRIKNQYGNAIIWGVDSHVDNVISLELLHGRLPNATDISQQNQVAVVDSELALEAYGRTNIVGKEIIITVSNHSKRFKIIGIIASQKDGINQMLGGVIPKFIYIPYKTLGVLRGNELISQIAIKCNNISDNDAVGKKAVATLSRISGYKDSFGYENISAHISNFKNISSIVSLLISAIAAISLIVAGLGIMNTMLASTNERKKEIGIMMAIGARRKDISLCFMTEAAILSGTGGIIGILLGVLSSVLVTDFMKIPIIINPGIIVAVIFVAILFGIIFSLIPAHRASRLNPVETLQE